ncbi:hypothetical protein ABE504_21505 [Paenibacillus oryzisoli]
METQEGTSTGGWVRVTGVWPSLAASSLPGRAARRLAQPPTQP